MLDSTESRKIMPSRVAVVSPGVSDARYQVASARMTSRSFGREPQMDRSGAG